MKVNVGELLHLYTQKNKVAQVAIARKMGIAPKKIQYFLKKESLQCQDICDISVALRYNFFKDLADLLPKEFAPISETEQAQLERISALEQENERLQNEINILKEAFKLFGGR
jgi:hypothetical protein